MKVVIELPEEWEKDKEIPTREELVQIICLGTPLLENEQKERFAREIEYANKEIDFTEGTDEEYYNRGYLFGLLCAYRVFFGKEYEEQEVHDE